jgi:hypothetical protein
MLVFWVATPVDLLVDTGDTASIFCPEDGSSMSFRNTVSQHKHQLQLSMWRVSFSTSSHKPLAIIRTPYCLQLIQGVFCFKNAHQTDQVTDGAEQRADALRFWRISSYPRCKIWTWRPSETFDDRGTSESSSGRCLRGVETTRVPRVAPRRHS